jgi:hypothetical protein
VSRPCLAMGNVTLTSDVVRPQVLFTTAKDGTKTSQAVSCSQCFTNLSRAETLSQEAADEAADWAEIHKDAHRLYKERKVPALGLMASIVCSQAQDTQSAAETTANINSVHQMLTYSSHITADGLKEHDHSHDLRNATVIKAMQSTESGARK